MVTKLDQMSRRLLDLLTLIDMFQQHQVTFISISESFDTNTPSGRLTLQVLSAVAEFERERFRVRVLDNMFHAANQGKWLTQSSYGYRLEDKVLTIHEPEAKTVRQMYDLYLNQGMGFFAIARQLNEEGIPSRHNKEWSIRSVKLLLTNPVYKGTFVWNRVDSSKKKRTIKDDKDWIVIDDCLPAIIDKNIWERVQTKMNKPGFARAQTSPHLLGGILKCGNCGSGVSIGWSGSRDRRYRVYRCSANKNKGTCTSKQYKADEVESWFLEGLAKLSESLSLELVPHLIEKARNSQNNRGDQQITSAKNRYKRKVEAYTAGLIELQDLNEEKQRMERIIQENQSSNEHGEKIQVDELKEMLETKIKTVLDAIYVLPVEEAKVLLRTWLRKLRFWGWGKWILLFPKLFSETIFKIITFIILLNLPVVV